MHTHVTRCFACWTSIKMRTDALSWIGEKQREIEQEQTCVCGCGCKWNGALHKQINKTENKQNASHCVSFKNASGDIGHFVSLLCLHRSMYSYKIVVEWTVKPRVDTQYACHFDSTFPWGPLRRLNKSIIFSHCFSSRWCFMLCSPSACALDFILTLEWLRSIRYAQSFRHSFNDSSSSSSSLVL